MSCYSRVDIDSVKYFTNLKIFQALKSVFVTTEFIFRDIDAN